MLSFEGLVKRAIGVYSYGGGCVDTALKLGGVKPQAENPRIPRLQSRRVSNLPPFKDQVDKFRVGLETVKRGSSNS